MTPSLRKSFLLCLLTVMGCSASQGESNTSVEDVTSDSPIAFVSTLESVNLTTGGVPGQFDKTTRIAAPKRLDTILSTLGLDRDGPRAVAADAEKLEGPRACTKAAFTIDFKKKEGSVAAQAAFGCNGEALAASGPAKGYLKVGYRNVYAVTATDIAILRKLAEGPAAVGDVLAPTTIVRVNVGPAASATEARLEDDASLAKLRDAVDLDELPGASLNERPELTDCLINVALLAPEPAGTKNRTLAYLVTRCAVPKTGAVKARFIVQDELEIPAASRREGSISIDAAYLTSLAATAPSKK